MTTAEFPDESNQFIDVRPIADDSDSHPIAHPTASVSLPLPTTDIDPKLVTNDGAHTGTTHPAHHATGRTHTMRRAVIDQLSDRDHHILSSIAEHRFLTTRQIHALHFADHTTTSGGRIARRTLARLRSLGVVGTLERRIGGVRAGSAGLVHHLTDAGYRLTDGRRRRTQNPAARFVDHHLAVADAHVDLVAAGRRGHVDLVECSVEPASWRHYTGLARARNVLKSDLYAETGTGGGFVLAWFIEIDLGTESIPTLLRKCHEYESYRLSGIEQDRTGGFPFVVWSVTHRNADKAEHRRQALQEAIASDRKLPPRLFRIVAPQQLLPALQQGGQQ